jgi:hypothetical protein
MKMLAEFLPSLKTVRHQLLHPSTWVPTNTYMIHRDAPVPSRKIERKPPQPSLDQQLEMEHQSTLWELIKK